jgi:hypothetical protein
MENTEHRDCGARSAGFACSVTLTPWLIAGSGDAEIGALSICAQIRGFVAKFFVLSSMS